MKTLYLFLIPFTLFALNPDPQLLEYQNKYTLCKKNNNYQITHCLLNGNINFTALRGDLYKSKKISHSKIKELERDGVLSNYVFSLLPQTRRYNELLVFLDYLYKIETSYVTPKFKGNLEEDILAMKRIFNLLQGANLYEDTMYTPEFEAEIVEFQRRHGLEMDTKVGPASKRALRPFIRSIISKVRKNIEIERISPKKPNEYVFINIPEFRMYYFRENEPILNMKVVVGKSKMRTPVFHRNMKYVVLNPRWNVPHLSTKKSMHINRMSIYKRKVLILTVKESSIRSLDVEMP